MTTDSARFIEQTTVDRIVALALNTVDKPESFTGEPAAALHRLIEGYGDEPVEQALARCKQLLAANPRDFTAAGAVKFLESALSG